jgi:hypothetical protein
MGISTYIPDRGWMKAEIEIDSDAFGLAPRRLGASRVPTGLHWKRR